MFSLKYNLKNILLKSSEAESLRPAAVTSVNTSCNQTNL